MTRIHHRQCNLARFVILGAAAVLGFAVLIARPRKQPGNGSAPSYALRKPTGYPQLVSVQPLPEAEMEGEICEWVPASSPLRLVAALRHELAARSVSPSSADTRTSVALERPPLRVIRDPFPTYSAVAVDMKNNEIVLQDENLFQLMVYDRMANTPPTASLTEPKRVIGGIETKMEFNCGLYIDPKTGDIYSINNDTVDTMVVFSRGARGNVQPDREMRTPHRTYGIAVDEANEELFLSVQDPPMVVVYNKDAKGDAKPIRVLRGNKTGLADVHGIGLDTKNGLMFVANYGNAANYKDGDGIPTRDGDKVPGSGRYHPPSISVYPIGASGNTPPLRTIQGPNTTLNWPAQIYVDEEHGEVFAANDGDNSIVVFRGTDSGNAVPTRLLKGPKTQIKNPTGVFVDTVHDELVVANMGNHSATVYPRTAQGDTLPARTIRSGPLGKTALQIGNPGSVAYDTKRDAIIVPN